MSKREAVLCDLPNGWSENPALCTQLAIGVCIACGRDICASHTRRAAGALIVKLVIMQGPDPQGPERATSEFTSAAPLCKPCDADLLKLGTRDLVDRIAASAHEMIRAALAARALK